MKKTPKFLILLFFLICCSIFYGCDESGDTDCQLFGDCGNGNGGGGSTCYANFYFDNYDNNDYTIYSTSSGSSYYLDYYGSNTITVTSNSCILFEIYDGGTSGTLMGTYNACPCNYSSGSTITVQVDF